MKLRLLLGTLFLLYSLSSDACGNEYEDESITRTTIDGGTTDINYDNWDAYYFNHGFDRRELRSRKMQLEARIRKNNSYKDQSDYALVLLKLGSKEKSLQLLKELIKKYPEEYNIVANLGTAYELNGINDSALYYIQHAVKINPGSHKGSEWIHVKILEAKIQMQKNPDYLKDHSILNLNLIPKVLSGKKQGGAELKKLVAVKRQLAWQLKERIAFVGTPDAVVADLLFDLANLVALTDYLEHSVYVYNQSMDYSPANFTKVKEVRDQVNEVIKEGKLKRNLWKGLWILPLMMGFVFLIRFFL